MTERPRIQEEEFRLPFHVKTVVTALWARRYRFVVVAVLACLVGVPAGLFLGKRTYEARTVLRYIPVPGKERQDVLRTELNQVKIPQNLAKVRLRLSLPVTLEELGASISVTVEEMSSLMTISARWKTGEGAAEIANTLRDIYLQNWLRAQVNELDRYYAQAMAELKTLDAQAERLEATIEELKQQIAKEQEKLEEQAAKGAEAAVRYNRLREAIAEEQARRSNMAELAIRERELERARKLFEKDLISSAEYEKALLAYQKQKAITFDSARIKQWREELERLAKTATSESQGSPTEMLLHATLLKSFDLDLKRVALRERANDLEEAKDVILRVLEESPPFEGSREQRRGAEASSGGGLSVLEANVMQTLARVFGAHDIPGGTYEVVAEAEPPVVPIRSTRKLLAAAVTAAVFLLGALFLVGLEALNPTIRSPAEVSFRLEMPLLGVLPQVRREGLKLPGDPDAEMVEASRVLAERLRVAVPPIGACVMVTSASRGDGRAVTSAFLASAFGRRGERVLLIDGELREPRRSVGLDFLRGSGAQDRGGLGDLLLGMADSIPQVISKTVLPNVDLLPRGTPIPEPEVLGSRTTAEILEFLTRHHYNIVVLMAPPVLPTVDAALLANWCHAVLLVVRAGRTHFRKVRTAIERLREHKIGVQGVILNGVERPFLDIV